MAKPRTAAAATMVESATKSCRLRCARTAIITGSIDVATRTTARTLWSVPWQPWQRSWLAMGCASTKRVRPLAFWMASCVLSVSTACSKSGPVMGGPAGRAIFLMLSITPGCSSASFITCIRVEVSVKASTPLRR
jgi:hypothetical protein